MNEIRGFRPIVKDDGMTSHWEIFESFVRNGETVGNNVEGNYPVDFSKAPITVHHKQFDTINFRRFVRFEIEKSRFKTGRPLNGRRKSSYKYVSKHNQAKRRIRNPNGSFSLVKLEDDHVHSITNE